MVKNEESLFNYTTTKADKKKNFSRMPNEPSIVNPILFNFFKIFFDSFWIMKMKYILIKFIKKKLIKKDQCDYPIRLGILYSNDKSKSILFE